MLELMKKKKWLLIVLAAILIAGITAAVFLRKPAENLLLNGDFSQVDDENFPLYWYADAYGGLSGAQFEVLQEDSGAVAHIVNRTLKDARFAQVVAVSPGANYCLHGYIRANASGGMGANLSVEGVTVYSTSIYDSPDEWREVSLYGVTGKDQHMVTVFVRLGGYSGEAVGEAWFRDVTLTRVDTVPLGAYAYPWYVSYDVSYNDDTSETTADASSNATFLLVGCGALYLLLFLLMCRLLRKPVTAIPEETRGWKRYAPLAAVMLVALLLRLFLASAVSGYNVDIGCFTGWANGLAQTGPASFYQYLEDEARWNCDYPPGYLWILWLLGGIGRMAGTGATEMMVKLPPILADLTLCFLLYRFCNQHVSRQASLAAVILYAFNPLVLITGSAWGQADALMTLLLILVVMFALRDRWMFALPLYVLAVLFKPQALMFGPLGLAAFILYILKNAKNPDSREKLLRETLIGFGAAIATGLIIVLPFAIHQPLTFLLDLYTKTMGHYAFATVNQCNIYFLLGKNWTYLEASLSGNQWWIPALVYLLATSPLLAAALKRAPVFRLKEGSRQDQWRLYLLGGLAAMLGIALIVMGLWNHLTYASLGTAVIVYAVAVFIVLYVLGHDPRNLPLFGAGMLILLCMTGAMMHERYVFPAVALLLLAYALKKDVRILWLAVGVSIAAFLNVGCVLDRNIRLVQIQHMQNAFFAHLDAPDHRIVSDMSILEYFSAALNCALCFCSVWLCSVLSREGEAIAFSAEPRKPSPLPKVISPARMTLTDWLILSAVTTLYAVLAFTNLGSTKAPQQAYVAPVAQQEIVMDLQESQTFQMSYYVGYHLGACEIAMEISEDGETWLSAGVATYESDAYYFWDTPMSREESDTPRLFTGRYVRFTSDCNTLSMFNASFESAVDHSVIPAERTDTVHNEHLVLDLGDVTEFQLLYYGGIHTSGGTFTLEISDDGEAWNQYVTGRVISEDGYCYCFQWNYLGYSMGGYPLTLTGRYVRLTPDQSGLTLYELIFRNAQTKERLPVTLVSNSLGNPTAQYLLDEQDTLEGEPGWYNSTYFDEIYHARTAYEHLHGMQPYECSHPPLGKVIMSWCVAIFGMTPFGWRFAGALAGVLMLPGMYLIAKLLFRKKWAGAAAATLLALDTMHFTQTRIATIDSFVVLFIIWMIYFMLRWFYQDFRHMKFWKTLIPLALSGVFMGLGVASKWTGCYAGVALAALFFLGVWRRYRLIRANAAGAYTLSRLLITIASCLIFFVAVPALIYYLSYIPYFAFNGGVTLQKIIDAASYMLWYHSQPGLGMNHPYYSPWYQWPLIWKPMFYFSSMFDPEGWQTAINAFGNPAVWWVGLMGLLCVCFLAVRRHLQADRSLSVYTERDDSRFAVLLICFFGQYLPWMLVPRGTYIYHYFPCVPIIILCALFCLDLWAERNEKAARSAVIAWVALSAVVFILLYPFASGALTPQGWMDTVRPWFPFTLYY